MQPRHVPDRDERLPIGDAARLAGVAVETLRRWSNAGRVPCERRPSGHRTFRRSDIEAMSTPAPAGKAS